MKYPQVLKELLCQLRWSGQAVAEWCRTWGILQHLFSEVCVCALDDSALVAQCGKAAWTALLQPDQCAQLIALLCLQAVKKSQLPPTSSADPAGCVYSVFWRSSAPRILIW